jgi:4-hydroxy-tetrahydrodipicolinate synthase
MNRPALEGIIAAIPTPFDASENLELDALESNLKRWNETSLSGYTVLGTTGEFVSLATEEKKKVLARARDAVPRDKVFLAGTGAESTRETIALTRWAGGIGADYAILITPHYNRRSFTPSILVEHYHRVAEESSIPIVVYHIPACTGVALEPSTVARISSHENVAGIKDSSGDVLALQEMKRLCRETFSVLTGSLSILFAAHVVGARGAILADACLVGELCVELRRAFEKRDYDRARALQARLVPFSRTVVNGSGIPGVKALLDRMGFYGGPPRRPLLPVGDDDLPALERAFEEVKAA